MSFEIMLRLLVVDHDNAPGTVKQTKRRWPG
jgi:hypothetical protein